MKTKRGLTLAALHAAALALGLAIALPAMAQSEGKKPGKRRLLPRRLAEKFSKSSP